MNDIAEQALTQALSTSTSTTAHGVDRLVDKYLVIFVETIKKSRPDVQFNARDVCNWAEAYQELSDEELPQAMLSSYAIGRILKHQHDHFDLTLLGSYGNRPIYGLKLED